MARIEGVDLPRNKRVEVGLNYLFGIGPTRFARDSGGDQNQPRYTRQRFDGIRSFSDPRVHREELESRRRPAPSGTVEYQASG